MQGKVIGHLATPLLLHVSSILIFINLKERSLLVKKQQPHQGEEEEERGHSSEID
jgi:hypothetical protein